MPVLAPRPAAADRLGVDSIPTLVGDDGEVLSGAEAILDWLDERFDEPLPALRHRAKERTRA